MSFLTQKNLQIAVPLGRESQTSNKIPSAPVWKRCSLALLGLCHSLAPCLPMLVPSASGLCHPESSETGVGGLPDSCQDKRAQSSPCWGDLHSEEKSCSRNRVTEVLLFYFWLISGSIFLVIFGFIFIFG